MRCRTIPWMAGFRTTNGRRAAKAATGAVLGAAMLVSTSLASFAQVGSNGFMTGGSGRLPTDQMAFPTANSKGPGAGGRIAPQLRRGDKATPLQLNADELEYDTRNNRVIAKGNVEIYYNGYVLTADRVVYDQAANTINAEGNARVLEPSEPGRPGSVISAQRLVTTADFAEAFAETISLVGTDDTRIVGVRAVRRDGNIIEFEKGRFTPCKNEPGKPPLWCIAAQRVIHDKEKATITYQDAQFELFGVPVLYTPYFQHADPSVRSRSGFLIPEYSSYSRLGTGVEVPYHYALDPSYDLLFNPMYLAKQGILWQGEWRQRFKLGPVTGTYNLKLAGIEQNNDQTINAALHDRWRGSVESRGSVSLSSWWAVGWNLIGETDRAFRQFYRLDNVLQRDRVNTIQMTGISERNYFGLNLYHVGGLVMNETLDTTPPGTDPSLITPNPSQAASSRIASMDYNYVFNRPVAGGELRFNANAMTYWQDMTLSATALSPTPQRLDTNVNRATADVRWRRTFIDQLGMTYTPFVQARGDVVSFRDTVNPLNGQIQTDETLTRGVGTAGMTYSYPWVMNSAAATHTIEPVGQIVARNNVDQMRTPDLDCRSQIFTDENLFNDKTTCYDRIDTGVRANYGLQYTLQSHSGGSVRVLAGQSYLLAGQNIYRTPGVDSDNRLLYSPVTGLERSRSDYVLGLYVSPLAGFRSVTQARFDEQTRDLRRLDSLVGATLGPLFSQVSYSYTAASPALNLLNDQQEVLGLLGLRLTERWSVSGQTRYSLSENRPIQNIGQLKYMDECYVMTANYIETHITDATRDIKPDRTIMFRVELKYLGEFRYKTNVLDHLISDNPVSTPVTSIR